MVQHAKLDKSDLHSAVQCLYFSPLLGTDDMKLLEVDKTVLEDLLSGGRLASNDVLIMQCNLSSFHTFSQYALKLFAFNMHLIFKLAPNDDDDNEFSARKPGP